MTVINRDGARWTLWLILSIAVCVGAYEAWLALSDPFLGSDSGYRVYFANRPVVKLGNRVWLPFLQVQIWLYHLLGLPYAGVKLISFLYFMLATACVGLYWRRILGPGLLPGVMSVFATVCFSLHWMLVAMGPLMQEEVGVGLFFAFVLLAASRPSLSVVALAVATAALMTRDSYWIYLFAVTVVGLTRLPWTPRRLWSYAALWAVPIAWLALCIPAIYLAAYGRLPTIPIEWPLMYNPLGPAERHMSSAESLWLALFNSRTLPMAAGVALSAVSLWAWKKKDFWSALAYSEFAATTIRAAPIACGIVYGLVWLIDPWQVTPGNPRAAWPLLEISFVAAPLLIRAAATAPTALRLLVTASIALGLAAGVHPQTFRKPADSNEHNWAELHSLQRELVAPEGLGPARVCIQAADRWQVFQELSAALFHERKTFVPSRETLPPDCDFVVIEDGVGIAPPNGFERALSISLPRHDWALYRSMGR